MTRGLCFCGCGERTAIVKGTDLARGDVKGQPRKYIFGHQNRSTPCEYIVDAVTGCWNWQRSKNNKGYGKRNIDGRRVYAHRHAWESVNGKIPDGMKVLHRCDNGACINPDHLFLGTQSENVADMVSKERHGRMKLTAEAVRALRRGDLSCHECAEQYGISYDAATWAKKGKTWKHVT